MPRTLIDKYVHYHKESVYACFVDFRKAFDSVWHEGLFYKLLKINIGGHSVTTWLKPFLWLQLCMFRKNRTKQNSIFLLLKRCTSRMYSKSPFIKPLYQQFAVFIRKHDVWSIRSSKWNQNKFTPMYRWFDYPVKIQDRLTKLSKRAFFRKRNLDVKNQSKENKNNDISKTPKEIRWHKP